MLGGFNVVRQQAPKRSHVTKQKDYNRKYKSVKYESNYALIFQ